MRARMDLHASFDLPPRLVTGDLLRLPVRVRSALGEAVEATLRVVAAEGLEVRSGAPATLAVQSRGMAAAWLDVVAVRPGAASLRVEIHAGERADAVERRTEVVAAGVPASACVVVRPGEAAGLADRLPEDPGDLRASLVVSAGARGVVDGGLRGLLRRPHGCFEQTSAILHPAILAFRALDGAGLLDGSARERAREDLLVGYQRILSFEVEGGGFSLYGKAPADPALTALGVRELADLREVMPVDPGVIERAARFLQGERGEGPAAEIERLAALRRAGRTPDVPEEVRKALGGGDPYLVALGVVRGLVEDGEAARRTLEGSAVAAGAAVAWRAGAAGLYTGCRPSDAETTALAVTALARLGGREDLVAGGLETVRAARREDGGWATTRETVEALRAVLEIESRRPRAHGLLVVSRAGRPDVVRELDGSGAAVTIDLGAWARDEAVAVRFEGEGSPWATLRATGTTERPMGEPGPLRLAIGWPEAPLVRGQRATVRVRIENREERPVRCPTAEVRLPAGLVADPAAVREAAAKAGLDHAEVRDGRVELYGGWIGGHGTVSVDLPVRATRPGRFRTGAARVYPYYEPDRATIAPDAVVVVRER